MSTEDKLDILVIASTFVAVLLYVLAERWLA